MPTIWRYLLLHYFQVFFLSISSFILILLTVRLKEIAQFASVCIDIKNTLLFALYQIPYILPFAIIISALIASFLLLQKMSVSEELTALRSSGFSLKKLLFPLYLGGALLSLCNFYVVSELTPICKLASRDLLYQVTSQNPLLLVKKSKFLRLKDSFVNMDLSDDGKHASNFVFAAKDSKKGNLFVLLADRLSIEDTNLLGNNLSYISTFPNNNDAFDDMMIENQKTMECNAHSLTSLLLKDSWKIGYDDQLLRELIGKLSLMKNEKMKRILRAYQEIIRRLFFPFATFIATIIGISFGLQIGRRKKGKSSIYAGLLCMLILVGYVLGNSFEQSPQISCFLFTVPIPFAYFLCKKRQQKIIRGME